MDRRTFLEAALAAAAAPALGALPRPAAGPLLLVGTYTEGKRAEGVYAFRMDPGTGALAPLGASDVGRDPSFLALHPRRPVVYAVNEVEQYGGEAGGGVAAFAVDPATGALSPLGRGRPTGGGAPCYVSVDPAGDCLMVANYVGGNVAFFALGADGAPGERVRLDQHAGTGPRADRQEKAHAHSVVPDPSGHWAVSADLGADRLYVYALGDRAPAAPAVATRPGTGPRHLAFDATGRFLYAVGELDLTATAYRFDPASGALTALQTVPLVEGAPGGERTAADVHLAPSGRFLYASVRGDDVLAVFAVDPASGALTFVERVPTGGHWPRNFGLDPSGRFLFAANQRSNTLVGFRVDQTTGRLTPNGVRVEVPAPVCVRFVG